MVCFSLVLEYTFEVCLPYHLPFLLLKFTLQSSLGIYKINSFWTTLNGSWAARVHIVCSSHEPLFWITRLGLVQTNSLWNTRCEHNTNCFTVQMHTEVGWAYFFIEVTVRHVDVLLTILIKKSFSGHVYGDPRKARALVFASEIVTRTRWEGTWHLSISLLWNMVDKMLYYFTVIFYIYQSKLAL